jgi:hypothetical protein
LNQTPGSTFEDLGVGFLIQFVEVDRRLAARTQIDRAIRLLVVENDPISAMTLVCAALDVLDGVSKSRKIQTWLRKAAEDDREGVAAARQAFRFQYNFLKHADRDPDRTLRKLSPDMIITLLYGAIHDYEQLYGCFTLDMMVMRMWALARIAALHDEPEHAELHSKLTQLFGNPAELAFEEARDRAVGMILWCERDPEELALKLFGSGPQEKRCRYSVVRSDA